MRRASRLAERGYRADADDGQWITTENGHRIHMNEEGAIDKGNQFVTAVMGKPKNASIPKKSIEIKQNTPFSIDWKNRGELGKAIASREDKDVVFGGFYKVENGKGGVRSDQFFNPYTGEHFSHIVSDYDDDRVADDLFNSELRKMEVNKDASWLWKRSNGIVQEGDTIRVLKGRTLEHGLEAKVESVRPFRDRYGRHIADYAYLDNGQKINVDNIGIIEDGKILGEKSTEKKTEPKSEKKTADVSDSAVKNVIGEAKTSKSIKDALKKAGYKVKDNSDEMGYPDFRIEKDNGGYVRIYVSGKGRRAEVKVQEWNPVPKEKTRSDNEIKDAQKRAKEAAKRWADEGKKLPEFSKLSNEDKWNYIVAKTAAFHLGNGIDSKTAWSRAIDNANHYKSVGYEGYGRDIEKEEREFFRKMV